MGTTGPTVFDIGVHSVEYSASDNYGQTTTCTRTVTVLDQEAPILVCPSDISVNLLENDENYRSLSVASDLGLATVTDNNDLNGLAPPNAVVTAEILMSTRQAPTDVTVGAHSFFRCGTTAGVTEVTYTATDGDGNVGTCTMTVEVVDIQDPTLACPPAVQLNTCPGSSCQGLPYLLELVDSPVIEDNSDEVRFNLI